VPGRVNHLVVQADGEGVFGGPCAEYCGEQHARMELRVAALSAPDFDAWLAAQARPARQPADELQSLGRRAFLEHRCVACHAVRGVADAQAPGALLERSPTVGPDLTHVGSRMTLGAGALPNSRDNLARWVGDVQHVKRGARMPSYDAIDASTLQALAAWLESLK
jgi:cytochrome c oxidase subunit 2